MKPIALANRLSRDLSEKSLSDLTADVRLEVLDAINGAIQKMDVLAPFQSRTTAASLVIAGPVDLSIGVTNSSTEITGHSFVADDFGKTIRISGDNIDNQVIGTTALLHPYSGTTGTVAATVYSDAIPLPEPYLELIGDPRILETNRDLINDRPRAFRDKPIGQPFRYWVEANARNRNSSSPSFIRFDMLPGQAYRMQVEVMIAPNRVTFEELLSPGESLPLRAEHVENYLLPIARGLLTFSSLWRNKEEKTSTRDAAKEAEDKWSLLAPTTLATPKNRARTKAGF